MMASPMPTMLVISRYCAFAKAPYAGSRTHQYYLMRLQRDFEVKLVTVAEPADARELDFTTYGIDADVISVDERPGRALFFLLFNWRNIPNYFGRTMGLVNGYVHRRVFKRVKALRKQGYRPDCILLEWTQMVLMAGRLKRLFPDALLIASEHDVSFVRYERQSAAAQGVRRLKELLRFQSIKQAEIFSLRQIDLIVPHNEKDKERLIDLGLPPEAVHVIAPYFTDYGEVRYHDRGAAILFFGAMDRSENYLSIAWFIERVFHPHLAGRYSLSIVGLRPHASLQKYKSENITLAGFVPDIRQYLETSLCMVAPLLLGAGIKVKVIEAMSGGLPVIGNNIAMEGIPAVDGKHYLHAEKPEDYLRLFESIKANRIDLLALSNNAKKLVADTFNLEKSYASYKQSIFKAYENARKGKRRFATFPLL
jgi:glycosyltransferase involved in cell wall biosynthesis